MEQELDHAREEMYVNCAEKIWLVRTVHSQIAQDTETRNHSRQERMIRP